jgi:DNA invertase Pin-like site-specific DNA recombinase
MRKQQNSAAIYCRLSRDDGGDAESNSIGNQREMLRQYAKSKGIFVKSEYVDDGISGTTFERDGFKRMIEDIELGKIGIVLCKDLSRLGRNNALVAYYTEIFFPENDIQFIAVNDGIDTFHGENEIMGFKSIINEYYARDISNKTKSAKRTMVNRGLYVGALPPYGYIRDPNDKHHLVPDLEVAKNVQWMFSLAAQGKTAGEIRTIMTNAQILTPTAYKVSKGLGSHSKFSESHPTLWEKVTIQKMLKNLMYTGALVWGRETSKSFKTKKRDYKPQEEWTVVEGTHEPLVDKDTFENVQRLLSIKNPKNVTQFDNIFRGMLVCSDCGTNLAFQNTQGRHTDGSYTCNKGRKGHNLCSAHYVRYSYLYDVVLREIQAIAAVAKKHENELQDFVRQLRADNLEVNTKKEQRELNRLQRRIGELDTIIKKLLEQNAMGAISDERFATLSGEYDMEQKTLAVQADALKSKLQKQKDDTADIAEFMPIISKYTDVKKLTAPLLHELIERIVVFDGVGRGSTRTQRVEIYFKFVGLLPDSISDHCASL